MLQKDNMCFVVLQKQMWLCDWFKNHVGVQTYYSVSVTCSYSAVDTTSYKVLNITQSQDDRKKVHRLFVHFIFINVTETSTS